MKQMLLNNIALKLLSVVAAIILWFAVVAIDDPVVYQEYSGIRVEMLNESAVTSLGMVYKIEDNSDVITVGVYANRSVHAKLDADDFTATADMMKNIQYDNLVGIEVTCSNKSIATEDIKKSRENVIISVEEGASANFKVVVKQTGTAGSGYVIGSAVPEQSLIEVSGPASIIEEIKQIETEVDITGITSDITKIGKLKIIDNNGDEIDDTYLTFTGKDDGININITVLSTKMVNLEFDYTGEPQEGYSFVSISSDPSILEIGVVGTEETNITKISIPAEAIDVTGFAETQELVVDIQDYLPSGVRLVDEADGSVVVTVTIEKNKEKTLTVPSENLRVSNLSSGYQVDYDSLDDVKVKVSGSTAALENLDGDDIYLSVDMSDCKKVGTYTKVLVVNVPDGVSVVEEVEMDLKVKTATVVEPEDSETTDPESGNTDTETGTDPEGDTEGDTEEENNSGTGNGTGSDTETGNSGTGTESTANTNTASTE